MKKTPTMFERDWEGDRSRVLPVVTRGCEWVLAGEGAATRKLDGTSCMVTDGLLYKRRELKKDEAPPAEFLLSDHDQETGKTVGWMPVEDGPEDKWHRAAFAEEIGWPDGTYELIGPKVQGNPEGWMGHQLIRHGSIAEDDVPRDFAGLAQWLATQDIEGIVFHHPDGRMAKIKLRDFGLRRQKAA